MDDRTASQAPAYEPPHLFDHGRLASLTAGDPGAKTDSVGGAASSGTVYDPTS